MKFFFASTGLWQPSWRSTLKIVQALEEMGFWGFLVPDQYMWDAADLGEQSVTSGIDSTLESWTALSYLASKTEKLRLGTFVTPMPFRPPQLVAKMVSTLDNISDGRAVVGVGAGATKRMFEAYSTWDDQLTRAKKTKEGLQLMLQLWNEDNVNFHGKYYQVTNAVLVPKPIQRPHPLLLFGGAGRIMLRLAGEAADICYIPPWTKLTYDEARACVMESARKAGRASSVAFAYSFDGVIPPPYDRGLYLKRVEDAVEKKCEYFMVPFRYVNEKPWRPDGIVSERETEALLDSIYDFSKNIMPSFN
jgi:alkanesulfonate monooxygenase SsuD/methylene tetrahydromethanopterin reductase-like flavin-dependent oxidoreductase (luciferase family)